MFGAVFVPPILHRCRFWGRRWHNAHGWDQAIFDAGDMGMRSRTASRDDHGGIPISRKCTSTHLFSICLSISHHPSSYSALASTSLVSSACKPQTHRSSHDIADFITQALRSQTWCLAAATNSRTNKNLLARHGRLPQCL
jgi:hypothetical protein